MKGSGGIGEAAASSRQTNPQEVSNRKLKVNHKMVVKQGLLLKRGDFLKIYNSQYHFYLEKGDENAGTLPSLKYGRKGKNVSHVLELQTASSGEGILIVKEPSSSTKFKIITSSNILYLKADSINQREQWITSLKQYSRTPQKDYFVDEDDVMMGYPIIPSERFTQKVKRETPATLNQISDLLQQQESKIQAKIDSAREVYERYSQDMLSLEQDLVEKKHKDKLSKLKVTAAEFLAHQKDAMELVQKVTKGIYQIMETIAEREIAKDPIAFIREESMLQPVRVQDELNENMNFEHEDYEELKVQNCEAIDTTNKFGKKRDKEGAEKMNDPELIEELEEVFQSAHDQLVATINKGTVKKIMSKAGEISNYDLIIEEESKEIDADQDAEIFETRDQLPFFKDPKIKVSIWGIIKDSIGKDLSQITVPVYFNRPLSLLQQGCCQTEYAKILDDALLEKDPIKRLGLIGVYASVYPTNFEKLPSKPFNPLLGETFELVVPGKYKFFSEQVSHHPPICATILLGDSGYSRETIFRAKNKLSGGGLALTNMYKDYINIDCYGERFLIIPPTLVIHNLIIGEPYMDAGNHGYVRNVACPNKEYVDIKFHKRGWSEKTHSKIEGEVFSAPGKVEYRITGKWNSTVQLIHAETNEVVYTWNKEPNPDNYEYMYGYTRHTLQFNYLTDRLAAKIAPTDSRLRPDQRALENGDFKFAASEKNRLEEKQRAVRKYREAMKIQPKPFYFDEWTNPDDPEQTYYKYNGKYFEVDRKNKDWSRLPDIYSESLPTEIEEFSKKKKK